MQRIQLNMFISPLIPAAIVSIWAGIKSGSLETLFIVLFFWCLAGTLSLILFGLPLILVIRKMVTINILHSILIALISAEVMTLLIAVIIPGRHPWYVGFYSMSLINVPCSFVAGISLWYFGFKKVSA